MVLIAILPFMLIMLSSDIELGWPVNQIVPMEWPPIIVLNATIPRFSTALTVEPGKRDLGPARRG